MPSARAKRASRSELSDSQGNPVAAVGSLALRALDPSQLKSAQKAQGLLAIDWQEVSPQGGAEQAEIFELGSDPSDEPAAPVQVALAKIQEFLSAEQEGRLAFLSQGAIATAEGQVPDPALAAAWGLIRSAQSEHPGRFALIDTDGSEASNEAIEALLAQSEEPQLALREGVVLAPRALQAKEASTSLIPPAGPWRLDALKRGTLESLELLPNPRAAEPLAPNQVRIEVHAAGLNFRDVLIALGHYPGQAQIGSEGAGVITEVGEQVVDLAVGDRVMGLLIDAFAPLVVAEAKQLTKVLEGWSFEQAAAIPTVFATAYYALNDLAGLKAGEKVLIHAGAGGVGMAAIGIAQHLGAEVFATASPEKQALLEAAGIPADHIASSRDLDFKERFLKATEGKGLDVVLNALAGEFVDASLELLPNGGRFLEMGKTDIREQAEIAKSHPNLTYRAFDLIEAGPDRITEMLSEILALFAQGSLKHSPITSWDMRRAPEAFRHLREGKNVGKVVLTAPRAIDPEKTILITGATGGLGALIARHLVENHGARNLLLASRSGEEAKGAGDLRAVLEELGAEVGIAACDVSDREQLQELLAKVDQAHPLGAVFHVAGALDDGVIESMRPEQVERVFAPKADAARHLHELTAEIDLSAFVMFSSAAGALGSPGQGNYAAANAYLDALAQQRHAEGLPASSIAWGLWQRESGMAAELGEADLARLARAGIAALSDQQGLELFDTALGAESVEVLALGLDQAGLRSQAAAGVLPALLRRLVRVPAGRRSAGAGSLAAKLAALPESEREAHVLALVRTEVAAVLGHGAAERVDPDKVFKELGFDSLAAVELRNRVRELTGLRLAAAVVFDHPSAQALASHLLAKASNDVVAKQVTVRAQATDEPIAIVGMACRYPGGVSSPKALWELVAEGRDAISEFPTDRGWDLERLYDPDPDRPHTSYTREGGFLRSPGEFDAEFFGISPREALAMDPQQRLLLEASWEALEDAGIDPTGLRGLPAGVFAGLSAFALAAGSRAQEAELEGYRLTGAVTSVASGRIAYSLGLEGPAVTIDTACSSSLVAMHLAAQALRGGECSLALAGGVTVLSSPGMFTEFSRQRGLSPDGRCKSFAEAADGVGWAEGAGMLVLERLSDAERNGHPILATIRGSAVNQDGASNGLTAPNGPSQERVIRQALANARLTPQDIDAVEAHGTGTTLGDPIEAGALLATYGQERERPLKLGSIKSNIGHGLAAAGVAGVIKTVMAMREGLLPKTLHVDQPSSKVDWEAGEIELLTEAVEWRPNGHPRRAAVSSFGISGTNAHLILEEAPAQEQREDGGAGVPGAGASSEGAQPLPAPIPLALSAKTKPALQEAAARLATHLRANPDLDPKDVAYSLTKTRSSFEQRAVALGKDQTELLEALDALASGKQTPATVYGQAAPSAKLAYLLSGQGSQRVGMGKELYETYPTYRESLDRICELFDQELEQPLKEILFGSAPKAKELLDNTAYAQAALFATEVALYDLLKSQGLSPDLLCGHSIGEISAAHISGVLSLQDATKLVAARGRLMAALPAGGAMVAIEATESEVSEAISGKEAELSIAAINGPSAVVISGKEEAAEQIASAFQAQGKKTKRLAVSHAFHSPLMEPMLEDFAELAQSLAYQEPQIPILSNTSGELLSAEQATDPAYWVAHVREPVRFADAIESLAEQGTTTYLELGPDPVLTAMAQQCLGEETKATFAPTLREGRGEDQSLGGAIATAQVSGVALDWDAFFKGSAPKQVPLPTYPFQRQRYWLNTSIGAGDVSAAGIGDADHPLLGAAVEVASGDGEELLLTGRLSLASHPWLADHAVAGAVLLPGTAFLELALRAAEQVDAKTVAELTLQAPLVLAEQGAVQLQVAVGAPSEQGQRELSIHSRPEGQEEELGQSSEWTENASGLLSAEAIASPEPLEQWPPEGAEPIALDDFYAHLEDLGLEYGPAFQGLTAAWKQGEEIYAEASLPEDQAREAARFGLHPALLDAALHAIALTGTSQELSLPFAWSDVCLLADGPSELRVALSPSKEGVSLNLSDSQGNPVAAVGSLALRAIEPSQLKSAQKALGLLAIDWQEVSPQGGAEQAELFELGSDPSDEAAGPAQVALAKIQEFLSAEQEGRLAFLSQGAIATAEGQSPNPALAAAWGLIRSAQSEHPGRFTLIDTDGSEASNEAIEALLAQGEEPQLALREGVVLAPRASRLVGEESETLLLDPDKTVLITGATGGLGALVARHLVEAHGARHLLLASRSGEEAKGAGDLRAVLEELGAEVGIAACDVSDREQLQELLAKVDRAHPLGAVFHAAGALDDATIDALDPDRLAHAFAPKAQAAQYLHELTAEAELSAFVMFSSAAGTIGAPGQGNYAAANAYLDALAQQRHAEGLPASSIAWGLWQRESGMAAGLGEADLARLARAGVAPLSDEQGLAFFDAALSAERPDTLAVGIAPAGLRAQAQAGMLPPIFSSLVRAPRRRAGSGSSLAAKLAAVPEGEREAFVLDLVRTEIAIVLGHSSANEVDPTKAFKDLGFDSLAAVELRNRLNAATGLRLAPTAVFDFPTPAAVAEHLLAETSASGVSKALAVRAQATDEPIAIVGMACRYPGGVSSPQALWELVAQGRDAHLGLPR